MGPEVLFYYIFLLPQQLHINPGKGPGNHKLRIIPKDTPFVFRIPDCNLWSCKEEAAIISENIWLKRTPRPKSYVLSKAYE